jgi:outer membrane receptor protein involved in Fe transport
LLTGAAASHAEPPARTVLEAPSVDVIAPTPLPGLGLPVNELPSNVQTVTAKEMEQTQSINMPQLLQQTLPSVNVNEIQGNPYQPNVNYRGFTASPLLGEPQGLSVFQDGVRINEPFGDVVSWDLIPNAAISTINLVPGSNPLFGLNTLGGSLSLRTKSGRFYPNTALQAYGGSWGRWSVQAEHGGYTENNKDYYFSGTWFEEDGWRDFSPTKVGQAFGKLGHDDGTTSFDLSLTLADTDLTGNGVAPESMLAQRRSQVFTVPDNTRNEMGMLNLTGSHRLNDQNIISGLAYYRTNRSNTLNGDANDDFEDGANDGAAGANGGAGFNAETGVNNRTRTKQTSYGLGLQYSNLTERNRFTLGASLDKARSDFRQSAAEGVLDASRRVVETESEELENSLFGTSQTWSVFATDTVTVTPKLFMTVSARFNSTRVKTEDRITLTPPNLDGDFTYDKLNPAVGVNYNISPAFETFAGWSQGNRAPSPIELGCADPANPCTLPNALASDPYLKQVVAQTLELGARGRLTNGLQWSAAGFRTQNKDDILFISSTTSAGFFTNFGKTQRQGVELGLGGQWRQLTWSANYAWIDATFRDAACLLSENNSSRGTSAACPSDDEIRVESGDKLPGIPEHQFRINLNFAFTQKFSVGAGILAFSDQYARGNENNQHQAGTYTDRFGDTRTFLGSGKVDGYALLNLTARYRFAPRWEVFARVDNVFDERYATGAILAENPFNAAGGFQTNSENWARETFFAPGAPRAGWIGIRYTIDRRPR